MLAENLFSQDQSLLNIYTRASEDTPLMDLYGKKKRSRHQVETKSERQAFLVSSHTQLQALLGKLNIR